MERGHLNSTLRVYRTLTRWMNRECDECDSTCNICQKLLFYALRCIPVTTGGWGPNVCFIINNVVLQTFLKLITHDQFWRISKSKAPIYVKFSEVLVENGRLPCDSTDWIRGCTSSCNNSERRIRMPNKAELIICSAFYRGDWFFTFSGCYNRII